MYPREGQLHLPPHFARLAGEGLSNPEIATRLFLPASRIMEISTNPLTTFGDAGTLAAFGFLTAYFLISVAAPS